MFGLEQHAFSDPWDLAVDSLRLGHAYGLNVFGFNS